MWHILNIVMKKYLTKITVSSLILTFSLASTLCCHSFAATTPSSIKTEHAMPSCHAHKNKAAAPVKGTCDCCVTKQLPADSAANISLNIPKVILGDLSSNILSNPFSIIKTKFNLAYLDGPPGPISDIPLYIQSHNFRI